LVIRDCSEIIGMSVGSVFEAGRGNFFHQQRPVSESRTVVDSLESQDSRGMHAASTKTVDRPWERLSPEALSAHYQGGSHTGTVNQDRPWESLILHR